VIEKKTAGQVLDLLWNQVPVSMIPKDLIDKCNHEKTLIAVSHFFKHSLHLLVYDVKNTLQNELYA
jgi:hypothetical protein